MSNPTDDIDVTDMARAITEAVRRQSRPSPRSLLHKINAAMQKLGCDTMGGAEIPAELPHHNQPRRPITMVIL